MLFNSHIFVFLFLPVALFCFHILRRLKLYNLTICWLIFVSLFFYGWWNPMYLFLITGSILFNFSIGHILTKKNLRLILIIGILGNLFLLSYYKYANFFTENLNLILNKNFILETIILPLGISFFTFQQITYLVDTYNKRVQQHTFLQYFLFVSFFPQLIAGPIVQYKNMMPQFQNENLINYDNKNLVIGITAFIIGLFKKVVIADSLANFANPLFSAANHTAEITFFDAWAGSLSYTFQLYFDFSGYADMALGLGFMFGIILPLNFLSPFKVTNIAEFWRRWHMTLSKLVRNYLYFPVSLNLARFSVYRKFGSLGLYSFKVFIPTIFSFFCVGLWHGAGWNFILFGLLHGFYLIAYNIWVLIKKNSIMDKKSIFTKIIAWTLTFMCVVFAFVLFRANDTYSAFNIITSMLGFNGLEFSDMFKIGEFGAEPIIGIIWILISLFIVLYLPNTQQFILNESKSIFNKENRTEFKFDKQVIQWKPKIYWSIFFSLMFLISVLMFSENNEFLYFQF